MPRFGRVCLMAGALALFGAAGARADTNAQCSLSAHVSFSTPITMSAASGYMHSDSSSWTCSGTFAGRNVGSSSQDLSSWGQFGLNSGPFLGEQSGDTCMLGVEQLGATNADSVSPMPSGLALSIVMHRTGVLLTAAGVGEVGSQGLALTGNGMFIPDVGAGCLDGAGWSSGWIRLTLSVADGPYPGDLLGSPAVSTPHHRPKTHSKNHKHHHRRHR